MHSVISRLNYIVTYAVTVLSVATFILAVSPLLLNQPTDVNVDISGVKLIKNRNYAFVKFDMSTNLTEVFNWNIKELWVSSSVPKRISNSQLSLIRFIYLNAEYTSIDNITAVIWDRIVMSGENNSLNLKNEHSKYILDDVTNVCDKNLTLKLHWNSIPNAGLFHWHKTGESKAFTIQFPDNYCL